MKPELGGSFKALIAFFGVTDARVSRPRNIITFADGSCEGRSRSEEEVTQGHRRRRVTRKRVPRDRPQPPSARRVVAGRHRFICRSSSTMSLTSRRRCFANSTPSRSPQTSLYSWDETLLSLDGPHLLHQPPGKGSRPYRRRVSVPTRPGLGPICRCRRSSRATRGCSASLG